MKFDIVFKRGLCTVARVFGTKNVAKSELTLVDAERAIEVEKFLEKLTGLRVHIEQDDFIEP